jgi:hypothetical protein
MLPKKAIEEYRKIYKKEYRKEINYAEADEQGADLFALFKAIYRPIPRKWKTKYDSKREVVKKKL